MDAILVRTNCEAYEELSLQPVVCKRQIFDLLGASLGCPRQTSEQ